MTHTSGRLLYTQFVFNCKTNKTRSTRYCKFYQEKMIWKYKLEEGKTLIGASLIELNCSDHVALFQYI